MTRDSAALRPGLPMFDPYGIGGYERGVAARSGFQILIL